MPPVETIHCSPLSGGAIIAEIMVCAAASGAESACGGADFPIMGTIKSVLVPENSRAAIYNLFRVRGPALPWPCVPRPCVARPPRHSSPHPKWHAW